MPGIPEGWHFLYRIRGNLYRRVFSCQCMGVDVGVVAGTALEEIRKKGYADKYRRRSADIYLIGAELHRNGQTIVGLQWGRAGLVNSYPAVLTNWVLSSLVGNSAAFFLKLFPVQAV